MCCLALVTVLLGVKAYVAPTASDLATATTASERPQPTIFGSGPEIEETAIDPSELGSSLVDLPDFDIVEFMKPETCCPDVATVRDCARRNLCHHCPKFLGRDVCKHLSKPEKPLCCKHTKGFEAYEQCMWKMVCDRDPSLPACRESNRAAGLTLFGRTALDVFTAAKSTKPKECCDFDDEAAFLRCIGQNLCHESPNKPGCKKYNPGPPPEPICCPDAPNHEAYTKCIADIWCAKFPTPLCQKSFDTVDGLIFRLVGSSSFDALEVTEPKECCDFDDQFKFLHCTLENLCKHSPNDPNCKKANPPPPSEPLCCVDAPNDKEYAKCMQEILCRHIENAPGCEDALDTIDGLIPQLVDFFSAMEVTNYEQTPQGCTRTDCDEHENAFVDY